MDMNDLAFLMGDFGSEEERGSDYRNIWVVAELSNGTPSRTSRQVLGKARELGDRLGTRVEAVLIGSGVENAAQELIRLGADVVYLADDAALKAPSQEVWIDLLARLIEEKRPEIVLFNASVLAKDVAPALAQRLKTGLIADCTALDIDESARLLTGTRVSFGGRSLAEVQCPKARPQMATISPNAFREPEADARREGEVERLEIPSEAGHKRVTLISAGPAPETLPLDRAKVLVVGGKGLGGPDGAQALAKLAQVLGGQVAGTRSAVEAGWIEASQEISGRGVTVAPDLYIGVGVSGSMDHGDAMRQSRFIVAINTNPEAPLMAMADTALTGDWRALIPAVVEAVEALRGKTLATSNFKQTPI
jgi:electron transfer flavoprotein alpha subunit